MLKPELPSNEVARLETLKTLRILDSAPEERFDRLTRIAKSLFSVPVSLVTLVDAERQWFKSAQGVTVSETPRDISFCGHAILADDVFYIPDAKADKRFMDNPLVTESPNIRFYAGCPLRMPNGHKIGTLCLIDEKPRSMPDEEKALLRDLAVLVEQELAELQLATIDELTLISNQAGFNILAQYSLDLAEKNQLTSTLILFDFDNFKAINSVFGSAEGDRMLIAFANILRQELNSADVFARLKADVFVVLLTGSDEQSTTALIERVQSKLESLNQEANQAYPIRLSAGVVSRQDQQMSLDLMLDEADDNMLKIRKAKNA